MTIDLSQLTAAGAAPAVVPPPPATRRDGGRELGRALGGFAYGGDYNPEQWPEPVWKEDVALMQEAGVNLVTVGVFSWANLQPAPDTWRFDWLDRVLELLHEGGIGVDLATATASPPPWLARRHPDTLPVTREGTTLWPGGRQHYCPSSLRFREAATELATAMAQRYADHPALRLWHIGNEYGCHVAVCYCDRCAWAFRHWLVERYGDLDTLNDAWGTDFWSQRYGDFEEILPPRVAPTFPNPSQVLDYRRFASDALLSCYLAERAVLDEHAPQVPITTNAHPDIPAQDWWRWAAHLDVVSYDSYPDPADEVGTHVDAATAYDLMRGLGGERPWMLMEQAPSAVNWRDVNPMKSPGTMRRWSLQAVARGADAVMYFQWRASRAGAEKYHSGMVGHAGTEGSRTWDEIRTLGGELQQVRELAGSAVESDVAYVVDFDSWWALELPSQPSARLRAADQLRWLRRPLEEHGFAGRIVRPGDDLDGVRLLVLPNLYLCREETAAWLERFAEGGGVVVVGLFSGIVDANDRIHLGGYPAPLRDLLGIRVPEVDPLPDGAEIAVELAGAGAGSAGTATLWREPIELHGAEALATHVEGWLAGRPAATVHTFGEGAAYYLGARFDDETTGRLLLAAAERAGCRPPVAVPAGVEVRRRRAGDGRSWLVVCNHGADEVTIELPVPGTDLLADGGPSGTLTLAAGGATVVREERSA
ncbi:beta-galactosidase [Egicoccus halophilus]|uniref:Beta-galactosidase n=1 Tax=Egicoccus halophilus TaxID=1670830 RepID=A0A8J3EQW4_9ACTN|nr:beta-galactosidase [Egicoccus halophilus]GGI03534.1 beta-galactosidase [Egicoccus halophilus]